MTSIFSDKAALMEASALRIATRSEQAIAARGRFTFALSGGSTPRALYALLASDEYVSKIDWSRVEFFWGDERCVPPDHAESNYRMARETLLDVIKPDPSHVHRMRGEELPERGAAAYEQLLHAAFKIPPADLAPRFDLVLVGLGPDGHTASLFPKTAAVDEKERWVVSNRAEPSGLPRLTLTLPVLNAAEYVMFLVAGADKAERLQQVLEQPGADSLPAGKVRPASGQLEWMVDAAAASRLTSAK